MPIQTPEERLILAIKALSYAIRSAKDAADAQDNAKQRRANAERDAAKARAEYQAAFDAFSESLPEEGEPE